MSVEIPSQAHYVFDQQAAGTKVLFPQARPWFVVLFLVFWLCGWAMGEWTVSTQLLNSPKPLSASAFQLFWLCGWTLGGGFVVVTLVQMLFVKQELSIENGILRLGGLPGRIKRTRQFDLAQVKNMRVAQQSQPSTPFGRANFPGMGPVALKFDYGADTIGFGQGLSEAEAGGLLEELKRRHPGLSL